MPIKRFLSTAAPLAILALAGVGLAAAQSSSPFASKSRVQAWEQQPAAPSAPQTTSTNWNIPAQTTSYSAPSYAAPAQPAPYQAPATGIPASADAPIATTPRRSAPMKSYSSTTPPKTFGGQAPSQYQGYSAPKMAGAATPPAGSDYVYTPPRTRAVAQAPDFGSPTPPQPKPASPYAAPTSGSPYAPQSGQRQQAWETQPAVPNAAPPYQAQPYQTQTPSNSYAPNGYVPSQQYNGYQSSTPPTGAPYPGGPYTSAPQAPRSWTERLGLGNIATLIKGKLTLGGAATYREQPPNQFGPDDGWSDDEIADAELEVEVSAITDGGLEYGVVLGARAQYDGYRRGFGGRLPDCPAGTVGCSGTTDGLRGHTSGFYSVGEDIAKDAQVALESAHLFLRSAYGDVTVGRDDGAAYLFSLGAPTLLAVGASNSPVDYTGYDSVKTVNDASGFAEKITYTSPRLLGDQIGLGVQVGVSYAPDADVCGVDYCNGRTIAGLIQPEIEDVFEAGLALDRTFENGLRAELTGTYARGSEKSGAAGLDDLESFGAGLEFEYGDWALGGSYLQSNNGLFDGDYTAYDAGLTWKPGKLGFTLGYGHAEDDNVGLKSDQGTFGITYDFDKFTLGTGVQYVDRDVQGLVGGIPTTLDQRATSVFVQGGFKF
ncbi:MAG: porin [Litorimonas sp.]